MSLYTPSSPLVNQLKASGISDIRPYQTNSWQKQKKYFTGRTTAHKKVFIKLAENQEEAEHEFRASKHIWDLGHIKCPEPLFSHNIQNMAYIVFEMIDDADSLNHIQQKGLTKENKRHILIGIFNAIQGLNKAGMIHRDFRPHNILVNTSMDVFIIDFQFLIDKERKKFGEVKGRGKRTLLGLWGPYSRGYLWWDDAYSALLIYEQLHTHEEQQLFDQSSQLKALIGTTQAVGLGPGTYNFSRWCIDTLIQLLRFSHKTLLYKILFQFSANTKTLKKYSKYQSRLKKLTISLWAVKKSLK